MAISTNDTIYKFGSQTALDNTTSAVSNGAFSAGTSDLNEWTNSSDAPMASFVLEINDLTGAATAGDVVNLYCAPQNIQSTNDHQTPSANSPTIYLGSFLIDAVDPAATSDYYALGPIWLPAVGSSQAYVFYIENAITTYDISAGWDLYVTPVTFGPSS